MSTSNAPSMSNGADAIPFRISWIVGNRRAHGVLVVDVQALHFVCLSDESAAAGVAVTAVGAQFGLIGGLISGAVSAGREHLRDKELRKIHAAQHGLPIRARLDAHVLSRTIERQHVQKMEVGPLLATTLHLSNGAVAVTPESPEVRPALEDWCRRLDIPIEVVLPKRMNRKVLWALLLSPVALALLYCLVCLPYAIIHRRASAQSLARYEAMEAVAIREHKSIVGRFEKDFVETCGPLVRSIPVEKQVGYVGELSPSLRAVMRSASGFPLHTAARLAYSEWSEPYIDVFGSPSAYVRNLSFGHSYERMLGQPFNWSRASRYVPVDDVGEPKVVLVAKVIDGSMDDEVRPRGRATMAVRAVGLTSGAATCEGNLEIAFPSRSSSSRGAAVGDALTLGLLLPACGASQSGHCKRIAEYAELASGPSPQPSTMTTPPSVPKGSRANPQSSQRGAPTSTSAPTSSPRKARR